MALPQFENLGLEKRAWIHGLRKPLPQLLEQQQVAADRPGFEQTSLHGNVSRRFGQALIDRADAMADLKPQVPQQLDEVFQLAAERVIRRLWQQDQQVDVRVGEKLAAAVAADCDQCEAGGQAGAGPELAQGGVGLAGQSGQHPANASGGGAHRRQRRQAGGLAGAPVLAQAGQVVGPVEGRGRCRAVHGG